MVVPDRSIVARIDQDSKAIQISQNFGVNSPVYRIAAHPTDHNIMYCYTLDKRVWMTNEGSTASSSTTWIEMTGNKPSFNDKQFISYIAIDNAGNVYVLLLSSVTIGTITSPLFKLSNGNWIHQLSSNVHPTAPSNVDKILADPIQPDTLYVSHGARVYKLTLSESIWNWQDISDGLPSGWIFDLYIGNISSPPNPLKVILRAAIPTRSVWERDVTAGITEPPIFLYVR